MIKINLLASTRGRPKKKAAWHAGHTLPLACGLVLVVAAALIGWRYWSLTAESSRLDRAIDDAQKETARLHAIIGQVQQFEQRRAQLQQRVALIEQLRKEQKGPVHMLDQISRSLPPMLWLTDVKQTPAANEVVIEGKCLTLTGLTDFVSNLEASGYFKKSVDIVSTQTEPITTPPGEVVSFQLRALFQAGG